MPENNASAGVQGVHAETKLRDASFVMTGHHCHGCCELYYVQSGSCRFLIDDNMFDLHGGDFILVPAMALHYTRYLFGPCRRTVVLFRTEDVSPAVMSFMPRAERFFADTGIFQVPSAYRGQVEGLLGQMTAEERIRDGRSALMRKLGLDRLLLLCSRVCTFLSDAPADIHTTDPHILQAAHFIGENYMNPLSTADVARAVGFSPNYLSRKFHQATGIGLHEYLVFVRLHHAAQELVSTPDTITTIALRCGFSDSNYFKDSFKRKYGVTPRRYRKIT